MDYKHLASRKPTSNHTSKSLRLFRYKEGGLRACDCKEALEKKEERQCAPRRSAVRREWNLRDLQDRRGMGPPLECRGCGRSRCTVLNRCSLPSSASRSSPRARCHSRIFENAVGPRSLQSRVRGYLYQKTGTHSLGRGNLPHDGSPERRNEQARPWEISQRVEDDRKELAARC